MAQYDGSIRINTQIESGNLTSQMMKIVNSIRKSEAEINRLRDRMQELANTNITTTEYAEIQHQIEETEKKLNSLRERQERFLETGGRQGSTAFQRMNYDAEQLERTLEYARGELQALVESGEAFTPGTDSEEYARAAERVRELEGNIAASRQRLVELNARQRPVAKEFEKIISILKQIGKEILKSVILPFKLMGSIAEKAFSKIGKSSKGMNGIFNKGFKNILKYTLGIRSLYVLFNKLRTAIKEGFSNLAQYSRPVNESLSMLKSSLTQLKNSLATAFAPILEVVAPALTSLINMLSRAATYVGMLIAALTGKSIFTKAIAVQEDYAASLNKTAGAAKKAAGALASFDTLEVLNKKDSGGGSGAGAVSPEEMFEEVEIPDKWEDIAGWLKDMWEDSDFYELGKLLGKKLKEALDNIPWDGIKEKARNLGKSLATLINGFIEVDGLGYSIGRTLAESFNTGFEFLNAFVHELHWDSLGKFIAETLNGIFENIDWELIHDTFVTGAKGLGDAINSFVDNLNWGAISTTISNFVNTFVDTIYEFVTTVDWKELGEKVGKTISDAWIGIDWKKAGETLGEVFKAFFHFISHAIENVDWWAIGESVKNFLVGIDWAGVAESFFEAIGAAIGGLAAFIGGFISSAIKDAEQYFEGEIEEAGGNIVLGILRGILKANANISQWIVDNIFTPFVEGFKSAFGSDSSSGAMSEMGEALIDGIKNGVLSGWYPLKEVIVSRWEEIKTTVSEKVKEIIESVSQWFLEIPEKIGYAIGFAIGKLIEWKDNVKTFFDTELPLIIENVAAWFSELPQKIYDAIIGFLDKIREWKDNTVSEFQTNIPLIINSIVTTFEQLPGKLIEIGKRAVEGIWEGIKGAGNWLKEQINGFCDGFVSGFKDALGIHSPSKVMEVIGNFLTEGLGIGISDTIGSVYDLFSVDKWMEIGQNMLSGLSPSIEAVKQLFTVGFSESFSGIYEQLALFMETWTETFSAWQETNGETFFSYDYWYEQFSNILTAYTDMFAEFSAQWQADMNAWWNTMVMPFFDLAQWTLFGTQMKNGIMTGLKAIVNEIGGLLGKVLTTFDSAFKELEDAMNDLIDDYNKSARELGTSTLSHVSYKGMGPVRIPALADGAVIRGGNPFLAILGDQRYGQTNIEAPLSTIKQAVREEIADMGYGSPRGGSVPVTINLNYNGETFARLSIPDILSELNRQGYDITALMGNG